MDLNGSETLLCGKGYYLERIWGYLRLTSNGPQWRKYNEKVLFEARVQVAMIGFEVDLNGSETLLCGKKYYLEHIRGFEVFGYLKFYKSEARREQALLRKWAPLEV